MEESSRSAPRRALSIAHDRASTSGLVGACLRQRGFDVTEHVVVADLSQPHGAVPFPDHRDFDLIVPMGSVWSVYDDFTIPWVADELELIRRAHEAGTPVLGICFGGQALAAALGGGVQPSPTTEIGWYELEGDDNPIGRGPWLQWHHDRFEPPPDATVLAHTNAGPQLFCVGRSVGTQFHPEVNAAHIDGWLEFATDDYLAQWGVDRAVVKAEIRANEARNEAQCVDFVDWVLSLHEG
jgi:GMP synthase-like glutamine amidotransferase